MYTYVKRFQDKYVRPCNLHEFSSLESLDITAAALFDISRTPPDLRAPMQRLPPGLKTLRLQGPHLIVSHEYYTCMKMDAYAGQQEPPSPESAAWQSRSKNVQVLLSTCEALQQYIMHAGTLERLAVRIPNSWNRWNDLDRDKLTKAARRMEGVRVTLEGNRDWKVDANDQQA